MSELFHEEKEASNRALYIVSLNHFVNDSSTFLVASLFPAMELAFSFSIFKIGLLVAIGYVINMVFQPLTGKLTQWYKPSTLLSAGISLIAVSMLVFAYSRTFPFILLAVVIIRFGSSFFHPIGAFVVSRNYSGARLDSAMGIESSFGNLGIVLAFLTSAPLYLVLGWSGPFLIYAILEVFTVVVTVVALRGRTDASNPAGKRNGTGFFKPRRTFDVSETPRNASRKYLLGIPLFFVATSFVSGGSNAIFGNYGNLMLYHSGFRFSESNDLMALWVASAFVGAMLSGWLARRITRLNLLAISYMVAGVGSLMLALSALSLSVALLSLIATGFTLSITYPATYSELSVFAGNGVMNQGSAFGLLYSSQIAGASVLGFLGGYLANNFGLKLSFAIAAVLLFASIGVVFLWKRQTANIET